MRGIPVSELVAMIERGTKSEPAPLIEEIGIGEVAYGLAKTAIEEKWSAAKLGPAIATLALDFATECFALAAAKVRKS